MMGRHLKVLAAEIEGLESKLRKLRDLRDAIVVAECEHGASLDVITSQAGLGIHYVRALIKRAEEEREDEIITMVDSPVDWPDRRPREFG